MRKVVVLDACVLYPAHLRDFLLHLAQQKLYEPKWTDQINDEWVRNVLKNRPDLSASNFDRLRSLMNGAFPNSNVKGYKPLMKGLSLPDVDDIHVLASAIKCDAAEILTFNIKHFPSKELVKHGIRAVHPDDFLAHLIEAEPLIALMAFENQITHLKRPPIAADDILEMLRLSNMRNSANLLEKLIH